MTNTVKGCMMDSQKNEDYISRTNEFKKKIGALLEEFRHFTLDVQLKLLTDVRLFVLEVEKLCSTDENEVGEEDGDGKEENANIPDILPIVVASFDQVMTVSLTENSGKKVAAAAADPIEQDCDPVAEDPSSILEETDIGRIADYLIGLGKLTDTNSEVERIIMNSEATTHYLPLSPGNQSPATCISAAAVDETTKIATVATSFEIPPSKVKEVRQQKAPQRNRNRTFRIGTRMNLRQLAVRRRVDNATATSVPSEFNCRPKRAKRLSVRRKAQECFSGGKSRARKSSIAAYRCAMCVGEATFARLKSLRMHERTAHPTLVVATAVTKLYGCDHCDRQFVKRPSLFAHRRRHAAPGEVVCLKCGVTSADAEKHALHVRHWHGDGAPFQCATCGEGFARRQQFERHSDGHRTYDCIDCRGRRGDAHCTTKKQLARHRRLVHGVRTKEEKRHECPVCQKRFVRRRQLDIHHRRTHSDDAKKCPPCSENIIPDISQLDTSVNPEIDSTTENVTTTAKEHVPIGVPPTASVEREVEEVVAMVRRQASTSSMTTSTTTISGVAVSVTNNPTDVLGEHRRRPRRPKLGKEKVTESPSYLCSVCGATFLRRQCLVRHNRQQHDGAVLYQCDYCDYRCNCKDNLKRHVEVHLNERRRRYMCELCGASFNAFGTLKDHHKYIHSDERLHACSECGKAFKCGSALKRHMRVHNDQRPYVCTQCTQSYKRMSHLKRHIFVVHGASFHGKLQRSLVSDGNVMPPPPPPTACLPPQQALLSSFDASTVDVDHDFLMMDVDHAKAACQMLLDEPAMADIAMPLPNGVDVIDPLPSMMQRQMHHHHHHHHDHATFMSNVDYGDPKACSDNVGLTSGTIHDLQPIVDVLQSELDVGATIGTKIADIFW